MGGLTWLNTLAPWQWAVLGLIPPAIIALYFLKLRRAPLVVPSTYLWHRALEDLHVNSLWQRLRRSLLLLLQLLLVALAILALVNPQWQGQQLQGQRFIFLIDNSASMSATDVKPGPTRLDEAKRRVLTLIENMPADSAAMLISFADSARVVQPFTTNRGELRARLAQIAPTERTTSLSEALRVASGLANPGRIGTDAGRDVMVAEALPATLYIVSDGKFPDVADFSLGNLEPILSTVGSLDPANVTVAAFGAQLRNAQEGTWQAYGRLQNHGTQPVEVAVELLHNGNLIDADRVSLAAGGAAGVDFELGTIEPGILELRADVSDTLALDDRAWTPINPPQQVKIVLVSSGNAPLRAALATGTLQELAQVVQVDPKELSTPSFAESIADARLVIFDRCRPEALPPCNTLFVGELPPGDLWSADPPIDVPLVIDTEQAHPMMHLVELGDVLFAEGTPLHPPPGATVLIESQAGPLAAIAPRDSYEDAVLGFTLGGTEQIGTNWPLRLSFPVFVLNTVNYLGGQRDALVAGSLHPGDPAAIRATTERLSVRTPDGRSVPVEHGTQDVFQFDDTERQGAYDVRDAQGTDLGHFAVNLFDAAESDLAVKPENSATIGNVELKAIHQERARWPLWRWLAAGALAVLLAEWYIYNRRVYV
ncbi:MAG: BatA and WFA domain-containing protein [Pirellulales bacterium]|nr:BatA and WFA domain-containing protein [Pirellulales bacterium]